MMKMITGVTLIDGTGAPPLEQAAVVIEGERITAVGREREISPVPDMVERWDWSGLTLMPGLIDAHVHIQGNPDIKARLDRQPPSRELTVLRTARFARLTLESGFTTVRDVAAANEAIFALRAAVAEGSIPGPRIVASGKCLTITGGHGSEYGSPMFIEADSADDLVTAVRRQKQAGADLIKIIATGSFFAPADLKRPYYTVEQMQPAVAEAKGVGLKVAIHAHTNVEGIRNAVLAGADTIEHGQPADDQTLEIMAERGIILIPTLAVFHCIADASAKGEFPLPPPMVEYAARSRAQAIDTTRRAKQAGVPIALGTDAGNPFTWHGGSALEMTLLVEAGLSPMEAIVAGTRRAAEACDLADRLGTVERGKLADLIAVDGNPLENIAVLEDQSLIKRVVQNGELVFSRELSVN